MASNEICRNIFTDHEEALKNYHNYGIQVCELNRNSNSLSRAKSIFPAMFGNVIDGNAVLHLVLEGEIPQNCEKAV